MTGRVYSGAEAEATGLVTRSVSAGALDEAVASFAEGIAALAPLSVQGAKATIEVVADALSNARNTAPNQVQAIDELVMEAYNSADLQEGITAMTEKRPPDFHGD